MRPHNPPTSGQRLLLVHYLVSTPLRGSTSSLAHCLGSGSDTICNRPSPPLLDIVLFWLFPFGLPLKIFKTRLLGRGFHTLTKKVSFSYPNRCGISPEDFLLEDEQLPKAKFHRQALETHTRTLDILSYPLSRILNVFLNSFRLVTHPQRPRRKLVASRRHA